MGPEGGTDAPSREADGPVVGCRPGRAGARARLVSSRCSSEVAWPGGCGLGRIRVHGAGMAAATGWKKTSPSRRKWRVTMPVGSSRCALTVRVCVWPVERSCASGCWRRTLGRRIRRALRSSRGRCWCSGGGDQACLLGGEAVDQGELTAGPVPGLPPSGDRLVGQGQSARPAGHGPLAVAARPLVAPGAADAVAVTEGWQRGPRAAGGAWVKKSAAMTRGPL